MKEKAERKNVETIEEIFLGCDPCVFLNELHLYNTFMQSVLQFASHSFTKRWQ